MIEIYDEYNDFLKDEKKEDQEKEEIETFDEFVQKK